MHKCNEPYHEPSSTPACPSLAVSSDTNRVQLAHGGGGKLMHELIQDELRPLYQNQEHCDRDSAHLPQIPSDGRLVMSTDSFVVDPLFFPGGDIGKLAVCGTCNDLAMSGALPLAMSLSLIISEGFLFRDLRTILHSFKTTLEEAGAELITGDTKVIPLERQDQLYINTSGVGLVSSSCQLNPSQIQPGDAIIINGDLGRHSVCLLGARSATSDVLNLQSDCSLLQDQVQGLLNAGIEIHCLRDLTRGGFFTALIELAEASGLEAQVFERRIPVCEPVETYCELMGYRAGFLANEGRFVCIAPEREVTKILNVLGPEAVHVGNVGSHSTGVVKLEKDFGTQEVLRREYGELLPRIC